MSAIRLEDVRARFPGNQKFMGVIGELPLRAIYKAAANSELDTHMKEEVNGKQQGGPRDVLNGMDLSIPDGKTFAVVGPSGCGKSTLLRVIAGLQEYKGHVYYDDEDIAPVPPGDRYIGMVFQNYALYPHFKGKGNLGFFFKMHNAPDSVTEERIRVTSEIMGIGFSELLKRKPGTLSGGEQQRVAIARAIVRKPRVFLFDEPLSNLDAALRLKTRVEIRRLLSRFGITAVYVTHDQQEAAAIADKIAVMREGRIEQVDSYNGLLTKPESIFVADFMGSPPMNIFPPGIVREHKLEVDGGFAVPLPKQAASLFGNGRKLVLGLRANDISPVHGGHGSPDMIKLRGVVEATEPDFGARTQTIHARAGETTFKAAAPLDAPMKKGEIAEFAFFPEMCYFFDTDTQKRIFPE
jgi:ABC-type sugar transport system ATPase subunit